MSDMNHTSQATDFQTYGEQPMSPRLPDSQQLQAQLMASLTPQQTQGQWSGQLLSSNFETHTSSGQNQSVAKNRNSLDNCHQHNVSNQFPTVEGSDNFFVTNLTQINDKSKTRTGKGQTKATRRSQKIKQILSERLTVALDKNKLVKIAPKESSQTEACSIQDAHSKSNGKGNITIKKPSIMPATASHNTALDIPVHVTDLPLGCHSRGHHITNVSTSSSLLADLNSKASSETEIGSLHKVIPHNSNQIQVENPSNLNSRSVLNQILPLGMIQTRPALSKVDGSSASRGHHLGIQSIGATHTPVIANASVLGETSMPNIGLLSQSKGVPISATSSTFSFCTGSGLKNTKPASEQIMAQIIPLTMLQTLPSITQTTKPDVVNTGVTLGSTISPIHLNQSGTTMSQPQQVSNNVTQLSPGSLSVMALVNQLINSDSFQLEKQKQTSDFQKSNLAPSGHLVEVTETEFTTQFEDEMTSNNLKQNINAATENCSFPHLNSQREISPHLSEEGTHQKVSNSENVMVTYQQLQSVISSLINGLQGQLDATRKLYSPTCILATNNPQPNASNQIGNLVREQTLNLTNSNQLSDIPYSLVPINSQNIPISNSSVSNASQSVENMKDQHLSVDTGNIMHGEIRHLPQHQTLGNQLGVESTLSDEHTISSGDQIIGHSERLVDESFLSEQSDSLYDEPFLYNKNIEQYVSPRGDNSVILQDGMAIDQTQIQEQNVNEHNQGCEDMTDSNGMKNQLLLSADPEEDFTDVPSMFKHYCILCKAAMLNDECQFHKIGYNLIKDTPILSKARTSIPTCLTLQPTSTFEYNAYLGVWTKESIPAQTKFGPLVGMIQKENVNNSEVVPSFPTWKIFLETRSETIDMSDENESNWMMFLKPARCEKTQNLIAHQLGRHIYFFTTKEVFCGQELLYWFSKEYATLSGYPSLPGDASLSECPNCGKMFVDKTTRKLHMKDHPHNQKFKCHICDHSYSSLSSLKRHTMLHMGVKPHICHVCHKTFNDGSNLKVHLKVHTGMKIFKCEICQKTFRQKAHLKMHMLVHTGQKNLKCYFCDKTFAREGDRKQHEYQHTKEKSYKCDECDKTFYKLQNYKRHLITHTGVRDFQCQFCMKTFGRKFHLKRHTEKCQARNEIFEEKDLILNNVDLKRILNS